MPPIQSTSLMRLYALPLVLVLADQASKFVMLDLIFYPPRIISVLPILNLTPVWNKGVSFGLLGNAGAWAPVVLTLFAFGVGLALPYVARQWDRWSRLGALMMAGGAIGNAIDRVLHGKVVDFIDFFWRDWHWPAFNIADIAIVLGAGLILAMTILPKQSSDQSSQ